MEEQEMVFPQWTPMDLTEMEFEEALNGSDDIIFWCKFYCYQIELKTL
jgi:hypothetical protein